MSAWSGSLSLCSFSFVDLSLSYSFCYLFYRCMLSTCWSWYMEEASMAWSVDPDRSSASNVAAINIGMYIERSWCLDVDLVQWAGLMAGGSDWLLASWIMSIFILPSIVDLVDHFHFCCRSYMYVHWMDGTSAHWTDERYGSMAQTCYISPGLSFHLHLEAEEGTVSQAPDVQICRSIFHSTVDGTSLNVQWFSIFVHLFLYLVSSCCCQSASDGWSMMSIP